MDGLLKLYLEHYVLISEIGQKLLDVAYFSNNLQRSKETSKSTFDIMIMQQPMIPNVIASIYEGKSLATHM